MYLQPLYGNWSEYHSKSGGQDWQRGRLEHLFKTE